MSLGRKHQVIEIVFGCVFLKILHVCLQFLHLCFGGGIFDPLGVFRVALDHHVAEGGTLSVIFDEVIHNRLQLGAALAHGPSQLSVLTEKDNSHVKILFKNFGFHE